MFCICEPQPHYLLLSLALRSTQGYIMKTYGMSYDDALALARTKRPAIAPNDAFERDLRVHLCTCTCRDEYV